MATFVSQVFQRAFFVMQADWNVRRRWRNGFCIFTKDRNETKRTREAYFSYFGSARFCDLGARAPSGFGGEFR